MDGRASHSVEARPPAATSAPRGGRRCGPGRAPGTVLIVTMWIVLVLAALVLVLARAMRVELGCSANEVAALQAAAIEEGAIQYVLAHVDGLQGQVPTEDDMLCEALRVGDGAFWLLSPRSDDDHTYAYGIVDEASKVNLNSAPPEMLERLPGMTAELAAAIVDWRDADSDITPGGAESEYYLLLNDPYECKNGPFETVEELFLVRDMTWEIVFAEDTNRNGVLDVNEDDASDAAPPDNKDGRLERSLLDFVTVYSSEPKSGGSGASGASGGSGTSGTSGASGTSRVNVNDRNPGPLAELLQESVSQDRLPIILDRARRERPFISTLDFYVRTGLTKSEFDPIANRLTTSGGEGPTSLININTAPKEVLACLPGLEDSDVSALLSRRSESSEASQSIVWVTEALSQAKATAISPFITGQSYQFSADIVSVSGNGRAFRRCRIVVDASSSPPRIVYRQSLTHLGWPLDPDIIANLRAGVALDEAVPTYTTMEAR